MKLGTGASLEAGGDTPAVASNADIVRRGFALWTEGDFDRARDLVHEDFELDVSSNVFNPAVYRGAEELARWGESVFDVWEQFDMSPVSLDELGDKILVQVHVHGRGRGSGVELDDHIWQVWTVRDGKALRCRTYAQDEEAARRDAAQDG